MDLVLRWLLVIEPFLPAATGATLSFALAGLLLFRLAFWKPLLAMRRLDIGIMHLGYLAIVAAVALWCCALIPLALITGDAARSEPGDGDGPGDVPRR